MISKDKAMPSSGFANLLAPRIVWTAFGILSFGLICTGIPLFGLTGVFWGTAIVLAAATLASGLDRVVFYNRLAVIVLAILLVVAKVRLDMLAPIDQIAFASGLMVLGGVSVLVRLCYLSYSLYVDG